MNYEGEMAKKLTEHSLIEKTISEKKLVKANLAKSPIKEREIFILESNSKITPSNSFQTTSTQLSIKKQVTTISNASENNEKK